MARVLIGNFKGPKGDKGDIGEGKTGPAGAAGQRGSRWSEGTAITGTNTTATVFSGTGIADALANDMYMNTSTGNVYRCTVGGAAAVAKWVFAGNLKGTKGDKGNTGAKGATGLKALQPNRRWTSTFTTVGATASAPFTDFNRNPVVGDVFMNADGSSNIGQWKVTAISGTTATFQLISYVSAKGAKGDTGASGTADTTFMEASALTKLTSGEPFKTMLGKIAKAVSSVFDKLDKSKVVNNQVTTETGYALDARQANPNIDGTLAKQVADLNGSLKIEENPNVTIVNGAGEVLNYKCGNLSMISIEITPSKITHGLILATGIYTPVRSFYLSFITIDGHAVPLFLNSNGELSIYYPNQTVESPKRIDGSFAYICA